MNLTHARMVATFTEDATIFDTGHHSTMQSLGQSLSFCWTEIYTRGSRSDDALAWMKANVIGIGLVTDVHENSPTWRETAGDLPHNRVEEPIYAEPDEPDYIERAQAEAAFPSLTGGDQPKLDDDGW